MELHKCQPAIQQLQLMARQVRPVGMAGEQGLGISGIARSGADVAVEIVAHFV